MNRRKFLKTVGILAPGAVLTKLPILKSEVAAPKVKAKSQVVEDEEWEYVQECIPQGHGDIPRGDMFALPGPCVCRRRRRRKK